MPDVVGPMSRPKYIMAVPKGSEIVEFYDINSTNSRRVSNLTSIFWG